MASMSWDAYVFGELRWPMPDPGLVAVWRAMAIDASRWTDWDGFVDADGDAGGAGTIAALVDGGAPADAPVVLVIDEHGVRLRACVENAHADWWQRLAIAWRMAADLDATGELVWIADARAVAYRAVVGDGGSKWEKLTGAAATAIDALPGRQEVASLAREALARHAPAAPAAAATTAATKPGKRATTARPVAKKAAKPARKPTRAAKRKR
jgi:hypothetical protein